MSAALHTPTWGSRRRRGPKIQSFVPPKKISTPKFRYETLEISEVFVNPYPLLSCNLSTEQYLPLLLGLKSSDQCRRYI